MIFGAVLQMASLFASGDGESEKLVELGRMQMQARLLNERRRQGKWQPWSASGRSPAKSSLPRKTSNE